MTLLDDVRYGFRLLMRTPGFTTAAVLTLALGIGAGTAVFSAVDTILRPAPHLAELIRISPVEDGRARPAGPDELEAWRAAVPEHALAAYAWGAVNVGVESGGGGARHVARIAAAAVDDHYFDVLRATPILGRAFVEGTEANVVLVSEAFWRHQLSARPDVVGSSVTVDGMPHTIVGVLPDEHRFPRSDIAIWRPLSPRAEGLTVIGRVARTTPLEPLRARLEAAQRAPAAAKDGIRTDWFHDTLLTDRLRATAAIGRVTVVFVLLIACANVANLFVARNVGRRAEFAARLALGSSRWRLARQLLTESALVASLGGLLGVGVALAVTNALMGAWQAIPDARPLAADVEFGTPMLLWALGGAAAATLVAGAIPAWHDTRLAPRSVLAEDGHATTASRGGANLQRTLVALQIAFAFALVTAGMLLARSFTLLHAADVGFEVEQVFTFRVAPGSGSGFDAALDGRLGERLGSLPGVVAVGRATHVPLEGDVPRTSYRLGSAQAEPSQAWTAAIRHVDAGYHAALGIPILEGRGLDAAAADGILVSSRVARRHWPGASAIGEVIRLDGEPHVIVGVTGDTREWGPHAEGPALIYRHDPNGATWMLRLAPGASLGAIPPIVATIDPNAVVHDALGMRERLHRNTARSELLAKTMTAFGAVALLLAALGVHASLAQATARRARELAIRQALGATPAAIVRLVLRQGAGLAAAGLMAGGVLAAGTGRVLQGFLPNVSGQDPAALLGAAGALAAAVLLACTGALHRAVSTEPLEALRQK